MATTYNVSSANLRIFPSYGRAPDSGQYGNAIITEHNFASLICKLIEPGKDGFLITEAIDSTSDPFEFNIKGYFVQTTVNDIMNAVNGAVSDGTCESFVYFTEINNVVSAHVELEDPNIYDNDESYIRLSGEDGADAEEDRNIDIALELFTVNDDGTYTICKGSQLRILGVSNRIDKLFTNDIGQSEDHSGVEFEFDEEKEVITDVVIDDGVV